MEKTLFFYLVLGVGITMNAQVGIGIITPADDAISDISRVYSSFGQSDPRTTIGNRILKKTAF